MEHLANMPLAFAGARTDTAAALGARCRELVRGLNVSARTVRAARLPCSGFTAERIALDLRLIHPSDETQADQAEWRDTLNRLVTHIEDHPKAVGARSVTVLRAEAKLAPGSRRYGRIDVLALSKADAR
jgi:hypothetical protein